MPNDCKNDLTIISTCEKDIIEILKELRNEIPNIEIKQNRKLGIRVSFKTAWKPLFQFTETLTNQYPSIWIKNEWNIEDGTSGVFMGKKNNIKYMDWQDLSIEDENVFFA